jgi:hypothetical protein
MLDYSFVILVMHHVIDVNILDYLKKKKIVVDILVLRLNNI